MFFISDCRPMFLICLSLNLFLCVLFFFFKQKTAYEMRISDWSSDVCSSDLKDAFQVAGRGELQLGVLVEVMRREGFELSISRPRVLCQKDEQGNLLEPIEEVHVDVDDAYTGVGVEKRSLRKAELRDMRPSGGGKTRITFLAPSRGLIGYHGEFLTYTRGTGIMNKMFHSYGPHRGPIPGRRNGVLIANGTGETVAYALWYIEERGTLFVDPGTPVYEGMIIGENSRDNDLEELGRASGRERGSPYV